MRHGFRPCAIGSTVAPSGRAAPRLLAGTNPTDMVSISWTVGPQAAGSLLDYQGYLRKPSRIDFAPGPNHAVGPSPNLLPHERARQARRTHPIVYAGACAWHYGRSQHPILGRALAVSSFRTAIQYGVAPTST